MSTVGNCRGCGMALDPAKATTFVMVDAWVKLGPGGKPSSNIIHRSIGDKFLCRPCLDNAKRGVVYEQPQLFE